MKKTILQGLKFLAFLVVGLLLLWLAFRNINFTKLRNGLLDADYWWLVVSVFFAFIAYVSRARRWVLMINPLGYNPTFLNTFYSMMTGYLANLALPRIGEVSKCVALGKKEKIPVDQLIGTVVIERTIDIISLLLIMVFMLIADGKIVGPFLVDNVYKPIHQKVSDIFGSTWVFWIILASIGFMAMLFFYIYRRNLYKIRFFRKIIDTTKGIIHGLKIITKIERKWEFLFHTILIWVCYTLMTWVVVFTIQSTSHLDLMDGIFLLVVGGLAMSAPVQSGLGAFHIIIREALVIVYGLTPEDGLIYAILAHESQLLFGAVLGIYSFYALVKKTPVKDG